jgi:transcriptional regulator with XRE-family HTH domain
VITPATDEGAPDRATLTAENGEQEVGRLTSQSVRAHELGAFLRSRRTLLGPGEVGLSVDGVRRTSGLRREETARLAGVSEGYYVRLEQGRAPHPSASVLGALARALRLSDAEREHLFALAEEIRPEPEPEVLASGARRMLELLAPPTAAYVIGRRSDVLLWNDSAAALFGHLVDGPRRPNNVRYVFTDPEAKEIFVDWADIASDSVAHLRAATGHRPDDAELTALVAELHEVSPEFRRLWPARELRRKVSGRKELNHPVVGRMSLDYEVLTTPAATGQRLVAYAATPGTNSRVALRRLLG